jgi:hypothetical protein
MSSAPLKSGRRLRHPARLVDLQGKELNESLAQFFLEERSRRSFGVTGYLVSGGGAGAVSCWFAINSLYAIKAPTLVLRLLLGASGLLLLALVVGFFAALAGYKAFDTAVTLSAEDVPTIERTAGFRSSRLLEFSPLVSSPSEECWSSQPIWT